MQKWLVRLGLLFFVFGCLALSEDQGDSVQSMLMYSMMGGNQQMTFPEAFDRGAKLGVVRGISGPTGRAIESTFGGAMTRMSSAVNSLRKFVLHSIYKHNDLDVREIFGWRSMLESSISTHILNVAKGARVVRAHVLSQDTDAKTPEKQALHGVQVLKNDLVYMVNKLNEYEPYYTAKADGKRSTVDRVLDYAALASAGYIIGDFVVHKASQKELVNASQYWQKLGQEQQASGLKLAAAFKHPSSQLINEVVEMVNAPEAVKQFNAIAFERATYYNDQLRKMIDQPADNAKKVIKIALGAFVLVRLVQWVRSSEAIKAADMLSDVNRDLVVHMIGSLRSNLNHLISLCDGIKEESDLVRVKDDFDFIGKNCGDVLLQIAYLIDQKEALDMQRLGKPGQNSSAFGQGFGGFNAALPKL